MIKMSNSAIYSAMPINLVSNSGQFHSAISQVPIIGRNHPRQALSDTFNICKMPIYIKDRDLWSHKALRSTRWATTIRLIV